MLTTMRRPVAAGIVTCYHQPLFSIVPCHACGPLFFVMQSALDLAHELCVKHGVFNRPLGLMGVWGNIVREWLDTLLPPDAADRWVVLSDI